MLASTGPFRQHGNTVKVTEGPAQLSRLQSVALNACTRLETQVESKLLFEKT